MRRLLVYLPSFDGGGAERMRGQLAPAFIARGFQPTFVVNYVNVPVALPRSVELIDLHQPSTKASFLPLVRAIKRVRPHVVLSSLPHSNIAMALALRVARHSAIFIPTYHNAFSQEGNQARAAKAGMIAATRLLTKHARQIVAVSNGVADDLASTVGIERNRITTIYNPVVTPATAKMASEPPDHPWFSIKGPPVILAVGRLTAQKDFPTLLRAFAMMKQRSNARLMILGEGPQRDNLAALSQELGIADRFAMPGFRQNPLSFIASASVLVMSSRYEGFGNVLVEGLACGTPTMSTDCPFGPSEILVAGEIGPLVPVGDASTMAVAMGKLLEEPPPRERLIERARAFTVDHAADAYLSLFQPAATPR